MARELCFVGLVSMVLGLGGCASQSERSAPPPDPLSGAAAAPAKSFTDQAGDFFSGIGNGVKQGWNGMVGWFTPAKSEPKDQLSLDNEKKPTADTYLTFARLNEQSGKLQDAEKNYQDALAADPKHVGAMLAYGEFKSRQRRVDEAMQLYQKAAKLAPDNADVHNHLGLCYAEQGKQFEAVEAFHKAITLQPTRPLFRNNMATTLVKSGRTSEAYAHLHAVYGESESYYKLGYLLMSERGDKPAAAAHFARALEKNPNMADARTWLAQLQREAPAGPRTPVEIAARNGSPLRPSGEVPATSAARPNPQPWSNFPVVQAREPLPGPAPSGVTAVQAVAPGTPDRREQLAGWADDAERSRAAVVAAHGPNAAASVPPTGAAPPSANAASQQDAYPPWSVRMPDQPGSSDSAPTLRIRRVPPVDPSQE